MLQKKNTPRVLALLLIFIFKREHFNGFIQVWTFVKKVQNYQKGENLLYFVKIFILQYIAHLFLGMKVSLGEM